MLALHLKSFVFLARSIIVSFYQRPFPLKEQKQKRKGAILVHNISPLNIFEHFIYFPISRDTARPRVGKLPFITICHPFSHPQGRWSVLRVFLGSFGTHDLYPTPFLQCLNKNCHKILHHVYISRTECLKDVKDKVNARIQWPIHGIHSYCS